MLSTLVIAFLLASAVRPSVRRFLARHRRLRRFARHAGRFLQRLVADCVCDFVILSLLALARAHGVSVPAL